MASNIFVNENIIFILNNRLIINIFCKQLCSYFFLIPQGYKLLTKSLDLFEFLFQHSVSQNFRAAVYLFEYWFCVAY